MTSRIPLVHAQTPLVTLRNVLPSINTASAHGEISQLPPGINDGRVPQFSESIVFEDVAFEYTFPLIILHETLTSGNKIETTLEAGRVVW